MASERETAPKHDGGPAFPEHHALADEHGKPWIQLDHAGMSLRDWFAGQGLVGLMSDPGLRPSDEAEFNHMAARLYQVADAMLLSRTSNGG